MNLKRSKKNIRFIKGDCMELFDKIPDNSIDLICTDLPYGTTKAKFDILLPFNWHIKGDSFDEFFIKNYKKGYSYKETLEFWENNKQKGLWQHYKRVSKENTPIVLFAKQPFTAKVVNSNIKWFREHLIWIKHKPSNFASAKHLHLNYTEDIIVFGSKKTTYNRQLQKRKSQRISEAQRGNSKNWRSKPKDNEISFSTNYEPRSWDYYDKNLRNPTNYIETPAVVSNSKEKENHPNQKPLKLLRYLIKTYSNKGDVVLDNTFGTGTTGIGSYLEDRKFVGFEKNSKFVEISMERKRKIKYG